MATAFTRAMLDRIKAKGGWLWVLEQIGSGRTMGAVAKDVEVSRAFLSNYMRRNPQLKELLQGAYRDAAGYHADQALQVLEDVNTTDVIHSKDEISRAKALSDVHRWRAEKLDRETFGTAEKGTNINLQFGDIGQLHVAASERARKLMKEARAPKLIEATVEDSSGDVQPVQAEIISEGEHHE